MTRAAQVGSACQAKANQGEQGGDGVDDQDGRQAVSGGRWEGEVAIGAACAVGSEEAISAVAQACA